MEKLLGTLAKLEKASEVRIHASQSVLRRKAFLWAIEGKKRHKIAVAPRVSALEEAPGTLLHFMAEDDFYHFAREYASMLEDQGVQVTYSHGLEERISHIEQGAERARYVLRF